MCNNDSSLLTQKTELLQKLSAIVMINDYFSLIITVLSACVHLPSDIANIAAYQNHIGDC